MLRRGLAIAAAFVAVGAVALPVASNGADRGKTKGATVKVADDFFSPTSVTVKQNAKIKFAWNRTNTNSHNVTMTSGPKKVKKGCKTKGKDAFSPLISKCNKSGTGAIGIKFKKKFDVTGTYNFICTIHPDVMKLKVKVKK